MENNNKRKLNIYFADNNVDPSIVKFLERKYEISIVKDIRIESIDLLVFSGGEDVSPSIYDEKTGKFTKNNSKRDDIELSIFSKFSYIPKLGICRGAQFLTVMVGGKLIQHVENHKNSNHPIRINNSNKTIVIPSDHHQMMYPFNLQKHRYELLGHSTNFLSNVYLNGDNENINVSENFLEPEIVYYPEYNSLAIQPHPEWEIGSKDSDYLLNLIDLKLFNRQVNNDSVMYYEENDEENYEESLPPIPEISISLQKQIQQLKYNSSILSDVSNGMSNKITSD